MSLLDLCFGKPATVGLQATAAEAIRVMLRGDVGAVAVLDGEGEVVGIFTERDVMKKLALSMRDPESVLVAEIMTSPVMKVGPETSEEEAISMMLERRFRHLPICDPQGKILGVLSIRNMLEGRLKAMKPK